MKRILYLTNIEAPYRVRFFNALADHCRLTENKTTRLRKRKIPPPYRIYKTETF